MSIPSKHIGVLPRARGVCLSDMVFEVAIKRYYMQRNKYYIGPLECVFSVRDFQTLLLSRPVCNPYICPIQLDWMSNTSRRNINLSTNQKGYDNSENTVGKLSARRIQICCDYFCLSLFHLYFQNNFQNNAQTGIISTDLDSPHQILLCRGLRSF